MHATAGDAVPGFVLGQGGRADLDGHRRDDIRTPQGNRGGAAMKGRYLAGRGARTFREYDQRLSLAQHVHGFFEHVHAAVVANVLGLADRATGEWVVEQAVLDHAIGLAHQADEKDHIDQRRVVGDDQLTRAAQAFGANDLVGQDASALHEANEVPEQPTDGLPGTLAVAFATARHTGQQGEHQQPQAQAAEPKYGKAQGGGQQAPVVGIAGAVHGCRCQVHTRRFTVWVTVFWSVSEARSQLRAWGNAVPWPAGVWPRVSCHCWPDVSNRPRA